MVDGYKGKKMTKSRRRLFKMCKNYDGMIGIEDKIKNKS